MNRVLEYAARHGSRGTVYGMVSTSMAGIVLAAPVAMKPLFVSKANTTFQILLALAVLAELASGWQGDRCPTLCFGGWAF